MPPTSQQIINVAKNSEGIVSASSHNGCNTTDRVWPKDT